MYRQTLEVPKICHVQGTISGIAQRMSQSIWAATTRQHTVQLINNKDVFLTVQEAKNFQIKTPEELMSIRALFLHRRQFYLRPYLVKEATQFFVVSFIRALMIFLSIEHSQSNHLFKTPPSNTTILKFRISTFLEDTNIQTMAKYKLPGKPFFVFLAK